MSMKEHILAALREQFNRWQELLANMSEEEILAPHLPSQWTTKDVIVHLWAWQQRSIARMEAAVAHGEPEYPQWVPGIDPDAQGNTDKTNAYIYETYAGEPWPQVYQNWRRGFRRLLEVSEEIAEPELLDSERYPWSEGYPLANTLLATYDHHQEHLDKTIAWRREQ